MYGVLALAACLALFGGCASKNATSTSASDDAATGGDVATASGDQSSYDRYRDLGYRLDWKSYIVVGRGNTVTHFRAFDDALLAQDSGNVLSFLATDTGAVRWSTDLAGDLTRFVGLGRYRERVVSASQSELFLLDPKTGDLRDRQKYSSIVNTRPVVNSNGIAIFGTPTGRVAAHNVLAGYGMWAYGVSGAVTASPVLIQDDLVGVVSDKGDVIFIDVRSGSARGGAKIYGGVDNNPVTDGRYLYIASRDQSIWCFDSYGRDALQWRIRTQAPITGQPVLHDGRLFVAIPGEGFTAVDTRSGLRDWVAPDVDGDLLAVHDDNLVVWNGKVATILDGRRGSVVDRIELGHLAFLTTDKLVDGALYAVQPDGAIARYVPR
ncbi:PQQ-binding-like beta-propeller repeat protein [Pyruvatibacter sp.]|uniref:outer membrane protein assembly factor BamB family protein n=1 Tax=Pyruvatibacter sp. TaxID=1981328 RepID=UPI0032EF79E5